MALVALGHLVWCAPSGPAAFARFVLVGGLATMVQSVLFLAAGSDQLADLLATTAGGGVALAGLAATSTTLAAWDAWLAAAGDPARLAAVLGVGALVGLTRFLVLRRVLSPS